MTALCNAEYDAHYLQDCGQVGVNRLRREIFKVTRIHLLGTLADQS